MNPDVSPGLAAVVDRALALEPADRYASAEDFRVALEEGDPGAHDYAQTSATSVAEPATAMTRAARSRRPDDARPAASAALPHAAAPPGGDLPRAAGRSAGAPRPLGAAPQAGARGSFRCCSLAIGIGAAAYATQSSDGVQTRKVVFDKVDRTVGELQELIRQNTR